MAILTLLSALWATHSWPVGVFQDDGMYVVLGKSLASGHGFRFVSIPGEPAGTHFPPAYPALLALLWWAWPSFPGNVALFKGANVLLMGVAAVGAYRHARQAYGVSTAAAAGAAIAGLSFVYLLSLSALTMSEPLFLALLFPALLVAERLVRDQHSQWRVAAAAGALVGVLTLVRSVGIALAGALVIVLVWRQRWRALAIVAGFVTVVVGPWFAWSASHETALSPALRGKYGSYTGWIVEGASSASEAVALVGATALVNFRELIALLTRVVFTPGPPALVQPITIVALAVATMASVPTAARRAPVTLLFLAGYFALVLAWPFPPARFLIGIWPLILSTLVVGLAAVLERRRFRRVAPPLVGAALGILALGYVVFSVRAVRLGWQETIARNVSTSARPALMWVQAHTDPRDVVATDDELMTYLYTGRRAVPAGTFTVHERFRPLTNEEQAEAMREIIACYRPTYVVARTASTLSSARSIELLSPGSLQLVDTLPGGGLVLRPSASLQESASSACPRP